MPLYGTLETMPLPDLLQWLGSARRTGTLEVERNRVRKCIAFEDGGIVGCTSDDPPEQLGQFLLSRGRVSEDQLRIALAAQEQSSRYLGRLFVEMGALSEQELATHLEAKAEETIFSLFDWQEAVFRFREDAEPENGLFPVRMQVEDVLLRGMKRFDEMQRIRAVFSDPEMVLRRCAKVPPEEVLRNGTARTVYESINGERSVAEILLHAHGSEYLVKRFLFELHRNGFIEFAGPRRAAAHDATPATVTGPLARPAPALAAEAVEDPGTRPGAAGGPGPAAATQSPAVHTATKCAPQTEDPLILLGDACPDAAGVDGAEEFIVVAEAPAVAAPAPTAEVDAATDDDDDEQILDIPDVFVESSDLEPVEHSSAYQTAERLEQARALMSGGEYDRAVEILDALYRKYPEDDALRKLSAEAEAAFRDKAYRHYLPAMKIPVVVVSPQEIESQDLSPSEFFLLSRIDGQWNVKSIIQVAPLREVEALLALKRMRERGIIELRDPQG